MDHDVYCHEMSVRLTANDRKYLLGVAYFVL